MSPDGRKDIQSKKSAWSFLDFLDACKDDWAFRLLGKWFQMEKPNTFTHYLQFLNGKMLKLEIVKHVQNVSISWNRFFFDKSVWSLEILNSTFYGKEL